MRPSRARPGSTSLLVQPNGVAEVGGDIKDRPEPSGKPCIGSGREKGTAQPLWDDELPKALEWVYCSRR